jgi:hypothetical protein
MFAVVVQESVWLVALDHRVEPRYSLDLIALDRPLYGPTVEIINDIPVQAVLIEMNQYAEGTSVRSLLSADHKNTDVVLGPRDTADDMETGLHGRNLAKWLEQNQGVGTP